MANKLGSMKDDRVWKTELTREEENKNKNKKKFFFLLLSVKILELE